LISALRIIFALLNFFLIITNFYNVAANTVHKNINLNLNYCPVSVMSVVPMGSMEFLMSALTGIR